MKQQQVRRCLQHRLLAALVLGSDRQALARVLVNHGEHAERAPVLGPIHEEIVRPHAMWVPRALSKGAPQHTFSRLSMR